MTTKNLSGRALVPDDERKIPMTVCLPEKLVRELSRRARGRKPRSTVVEDLLRVGLEAERSSAGS